MAAVGNRRKFVASDYVYFPSFIWFCPRSVDRNEAILAYAHFSNVVLVDIRENCPRLVGLISFPEKVIALQFAKFDSSLLAVGDAAGHLRVFKVKGDSHIEKRSIKIKGLCAVEWSNSSSQSIYISTESSFVTEWHAFQKQRKQHRFNFTGCITNMATNPRKSHILAIALKNGNVYIVDMNTDTRVNFLDPQPVSVVIDLFWSTYSERLFICYKSGQVRVSTILEDGNVLDKAYEVSSAPSEEKIPKKKSKYAVRGTAWCHAAEHPVDPRFILVCSSQGKVGMINIEEENSTIQYMENKLRRNNKMMFIILKWSENTVFTYSKDFLLTIWDINKMQAINEIPTLNNQIRSIAFSPHTYGKLSIASSEPVISNWNLNVQPPEYNMHFSFTANPAESCQVTSIAFHPEKDILAFGTAKGRVGYADDKRKFVHFKVSHESQVTRLTWGPCSLLDAAEETEDQKLHQKLYLYSCGGGKICVRDPDNLQKKFINLDTLLHPKEDINEQIEHSEICWKPDYSQFAIGNKNEIINIYDGNTFQRILHLQAADYVNVIRWHRSHVYKTESLSPIRNWLAVGSESRIVDVFDTGEVQACSDGSAVPIISSATIRLRGHTRSVTALEWSVMDEELLASGSADCTVKVWNVASGLLMVDFTGHCKSISTLAWNLFDKDMIFSGGADSCLIGWKLSDQPKVCPVSAEETSEVKSSKRIRKQKRFKPDHFAEKVNDGKEEVVSEGPVTRGSKRHRMLQELFAEADVTSKAMSQQHKAMENMKIQTHDEQEAVQSSRTHSSGTLFKLLCPKQLKANENCLLKDIVTFDSKVRSCSKEPFMEKPDLQKRIDNFLPLLGSKTEVLTMINAVLDNWNQYPGLVAGQNKVLYELFIFCILLSNFDTLTEFGFCNSYVGIHSVALAPMVSRSHMLKELEQYVAFVSNMFYRPVYPLFIMAVHGIEAAIRYLMGRKRYNNAYALAKYHLPKDDALTREIFERLLSTLQELRHLEAAIYLCNEDNPLYAARFLTKLNTAKAFHVAAGLCDKFGEASRAENYCATSLMKSLIAGETRDVISLLYEQDLTDLLWVVVVYSFLVNHIQMLKTESDLCGFIEENIFNQKTANTHVLWQKYRVEGKKFLRYMYDILVRENIFNPSSTQFWDTYCIWRNIHIKRTTLSSVNEAIYFVTVSVCNVFYVLFTDDSERKFESAINELSSALEICSNSKLPSELRAVCLLLLPFDILWSEENAFFEIEMHEEPDSNIIDEVYEWLGKKIVQKNAFKHGISSCEIMQNMYKKYNMEELEQALLSVNAIDIIIMIFASSLANEISSGKFKTFSSCECTEESHCSINKRDHKAEDIINSSVHINEQSNHYLMLGETSSTLISSNLTSDILVLNEELKNSCIKEDQGIEHSLQLMRSSHEDHFCSKNNEDNEEECKEDIENSLCLKQGDLKNSDLIESKIVTLTNPVNSFGVKTADSDDISMVNNIPICFSDLDTENLKNFMGLKNGSIVNSSCLENENSSDSSILETKFSKSCSDLENENPSISYDFGNKDPNNSPSLKNDTKSPSTLENEDPSSCSTLESKTFKTNIDLENGSPGISHNLKGGNLNNFPSLRNDDPRDFLTLEIEDPDKCSIFKNCPDIENGNPKISHEIGSVDLINSPVLKKYDPEIASTSENEDPNYCSTCESKAFKNDTDLENRSREISYHVDSGNLNNSPSLKNNDPGDSLTLKIEDPSKCSIFENCPDLENGNAKISHETRSRDLNNSPDFENYDFKNAPTSENEDPNGCPSFENKVFKNCANLENGNPEISHISGTEDLNNFPSLENETSNDSFNLTNKISSVVDTRVSQAFHSSDNEELNSSSVLMNDNLKDFSVLGDKVSNSCSNLIDVSPIISLNLENKNSNESDCLKSYEDPKAVSSQNENKKKSLEAFKNEDINNSFALDDYNPERCACLEQFKKLFDILNNIVALICRDIYKVNPSNRRFIFQKPLTSNKVQRDVTVTESLSSKEHLLKTERFFLHEKIKHYQEFTYLLSLVKTKGQVTHFPDVVAACNHVISCFVEIEKQSVCDHVKCKAKLLGDRLISWRDNKF